MCLNQLYFIEFNLRKTYLTGSFNSFTDAQVAYQPCQEKAQDQPRSKVSNFSYVFCYLQYFISVVCTILIPKTTVFKLFTIKTMIIKFKIPSILKEKLRKFVYSFQSKKCSQFLLILIIFL